MLFPDTQIQTRRMKEVWSIIKDSDSILYVEENHHEETLGSELDVIMPLGLPSSIDPPNQGFFVEPEANKLANQGMIL